MPETCIRFGEHGARIMIEDKEVPHYAMHFDPAKKEVSCWIASEAGKAFSVVWLELDVEYTSSCDLYLDGHRADSYLRPHHYARSIAIRHGPVSELSQAPFLFSTLVVTDDDTLAYLDTSLSHSIGEIKLIITRTAEATIEAKCTNYSALPNLQKVHERSKKAMAHRVNYGSEIPMESTRKWCHVASHEKLVTFIFKYRPLEILRAIDIVPRNPEPLEPLPTSETSSGKREHSKVKNEAESGSESEDSDEDSMREKVLLAELEKIRKGKHLKDSTSKRPKKKLKKEHEDKPHFTPGEVIDLT